MYEPNGVLYGLKSNGDLLWYRHNNRRSPGSGIEGPRVVRIGMTAGAVVAGDDGVLYSTPPAGDRDSGQLTWWRHRGRVDGVDDWEGPRVVLDNWGPFVHVFTAPGGIMYGVRPNGELVWYRHLGRDAGTPEWDGPNNVGKGWDRFSQAFSGFDGRVYAVVKTPTTWLELNRDMPVEPLEDQHLLAPGSLAQLAAAGAQAAAGKPAPKPETRPDSFDAGDVLMYRHLGQQEGKFIWDVPVKVAFGWDRFKHVFAGGDDIVYAVGPKADDWAARHLEDKVTPIPAGPPVVKLPVDPIVKPVKQPARPPRPSAAYDLLWLNHTGAGPGAPDWVGPEKIGQGWQDFTSLTCGGPELREWAAQKIFDYWLANTAITTVGTPTGPPIPVASTYTQRFSFGRISQPLVGDAEVSNRHLVTISIVGIRMFASDDPGGEDEPHIVTTAYAIDKIEGVKAEDTRSLYLGEQETNAVFGQDYQIANGMFVPGDGAVHVDVALWDDEAIGVSNEVIPAIRDKVSDAITAWLPVVGGAVGTAAGGPGGFVVGGLAGGALAQLLAGTGVSDDIGTLIGKFIVGLFGPDLIGHKGFSISHEYLSRLRDNPQSLERTSVSINGMAYNFPEGPEDDSWLFERGHGTYRVFMRVALTKTD